MKIGNIDFKNGIFLAPMAGVTEVGFRKVCEMCGAEMCVTEMISAKGLFYDSAKTKELLAFPSQTKCKVVQLFGSDALIMGQVVKSFGTTYDIIDINMGCPAPKIVKNGDGCALMLDIEKAKDIISTCVKNASVPVTVKFRSGFNEDNINAVAFAKMCEEAGASAITIHARTREQFYSGKSDLNVIKQVVNAVKIPVIGNGDVVDYESYKKMKEYTGCAGVAIGRGALGNPQIFSEIIQVPAPISKKEAIKIHIEELSKYFSEESLCKHFRKHLLWYLSGIPNIKDVKEKATKVETINEIYSIVNQVFN